MGILCFNEKKDERSILSSISWYVRHLHRKYLFFPLLFPALMFGQSALSNLEEVVVTARKKTESLSKYFSEESLIKYRLKIEIEYFIALCKIPLPELKNFKFESDKLFFSIRIS